MVMIRKTQIKDAIRNIIKQKVSWISVCLIVCLGVASYLGIHYASFAMKRGGQEFYDETNFRDIQFISTLLFSEADVGAIRQVEGVEDAEGLYQTTATLHAGNFKKGVSVQSATSRISVPVLVEGRMPKNSTECVIEKALMDKLSISVGDDISLKSSSGNVPQYLFSSEYTVVGSVLHPDHITARLPENLYVIVEPEAFNPVETLWSFSRIEVRLSEGKDINTFDNDYFDAIAPVERRLNDLGAERSSLRDMYLKDTISDAANRLEAAEFVYEFLTRLVEGDDWSTINKLLKIWEQVDDTGTLRDAFIESYRQAENSEGYIGDISHSLSKSQKKIAENTTEKYEDELELLKKLPQEDIEIIRAVMDAGIWKSRSEMRAYLDSYGEKLKDARERLEYLEDFIKRIGSCRWFSFNRRANAAYVDLAMVADNLKNLSMTFSMLFLVVGALVCYATIGRMADEQRTLIGTTKALGFYSGEVFFKYLSFGVLAVALGICGGILLAYYGLETIIRKGYSSMYVFGEAPPSFVGEQTVIVAAVGLLLSVAAAIIACRRLLGRTAISLMKGEAVSDKKRILVTVTSVAGCCALLVIGFSIKFAVGGVIDRQYGGIVRYDKKLRFNIDAGDSAASEIEKVLKAYGTDYLRVVDKFYTYQVTDTMELAELICADPERVSEYFRLADAKTGAIIIPPSDGILIQKRLAEVYDLSVGDSFTIYDENVNGYKVKIAGIFNNYTGRAMAISEEYYKEVFGTDPDEATYFVKLNGADERKLRASLKKIKAFTSLTRSDTSRELFASISAILNAVIVLLIVLAAIMASVVLLNLANLYVMQKKKELCIMRINGFTISETIWYVAKESIITTILGIAAGLAGGEVLSYKIIRTLEQPHIQLVRTPNPTAFIFASLITAVFSLIVNAAALRKVKDFKLSDVV